MRLARGLVAIGYGLFCLTGCREGMDTSNVRRDARGPGQSAAALHGAQDSLQARYRARGESISGIWPSAPDGRYIAVAVRRDQDLREIRLEVWAQPITTTSQPVTQSEPESGEAEFDLIFFEDMTGEGFPDLFLAAFTEEELAYPLFFAWTEARGLLKERLQAEHAPSLRGSISPDSIQVIRSDKAVCAISLPASNQGMGGTARFYFAWDRDGARLQPAAQTPRC